MENEIALRRIKEKRARYVSHEEFLNNCISKSYIPPGFTLHWTSDVEMNQDISDKCWKIQRDASIKLMEFTKDACRMKICELTDEVVSRETVSDPQSIFNTDMYEKKEKSRMDRIKDNKLSKAAESTFREIKVKGDGNCFFRCLSFHLFGDENRHCDIRKNIVAFMTANIDDFIPYIDGSIQEHLENMSFSDGRSESWATEAEVMAASALYEVNVKVKVKYRGRFAWHAYTLRMKGKNGANEVLSGQIPYNENIYVVYRSNHYNFLLHETLDLARTGAGETLTIATDTQGASTDWFDLGHVSCAENDEPVAEETRGGLDGKSNDYTYSACGHSTAADRSRLNTDGPVSAMKFTSGTCEQLNDNDYPARGHSAAADIPIQDKASRKPNRKKIQKRKPEVKSQNRKPVKRTVRTDSVATDFEAPTDTQTIRQTQEKDRNIIKTNQNGGGQNNKDRGTLSDIKELVTNLSSHTLTDAELSLLEKGLKFVPDRSKINSTKLLADLGEWERRMRLREYFYKADDDNDDDTDEEEDKKGKFKIKQKSFFTPRQGRDQWLDTYIELVKNDVINNLKKGGKLNLSQDEKNAFYSLLHNEDIVIRPADKGSGIVVVDKTEYINRLHKEMTDSKSYVEIPEDLTETATKTVKKLVNKMYKEGVINKDLQQYLTPKYPKNGKLKGNPKLHKNGAPFRTIVSGVNTPTERMAEVAEYELNDFVINSPTYIKDTTDFINKLREIDTNIPKNAILFCFDVEKLYPSVPRTEGLQACREALDSRTNPIIPTDNAIEIIETVLDFNGFGLGERNYRQTDGIAIGSRLGRNFACAYMRKWDEQLLEYQHKPFFYKRYIDDGFGIWDGDLKSLQDFKDYANNIHTNIRIQLRWSMDQVEFLDTVVKLDNGQVYTDLYVKPTDKQLYLRHDSCHPAHTKKSLAYGLGIRIRRICDRDDDYFKHRADLKKQLRKRGYSGKLIEQQLRKVDKMDREKLLENKTRNDKSDRVPLVLTYSKLLPDIRTILRKHQATLHKSERMREIFDKAPLLAFRRDKSLRDVLVHRKTVSR